MIRDVTIPARLCRCDVCSYEWISTAILIVSHCQNRKCRSRLWNGKKIKRKTERKPTLVLPKVVKVRGGEDNGSETT